MKLVEYIFSKIDKKEFIKELINSDFSFKKKSKIDICRTSENIVSQGSFGQLINAPLISMKVKEEEYNLIREYNFEELFEHYFIDGFFFKKVKGFSLVYTGEIRVLREDRVIEKDFEEAHYTLNFCCFFFLEEKKFYLLTYHFSKGFYGLGDAQDCYELNKIFNFKPTKEQIKSEYEKYLTYVKKEFKDSTIEIFSRTTYPTKDEIKFYSKKFNEILDIDYK